jgi:outer membrane immunogenic protein
MKRLSAALLSAVSTLTVAQVTSAADLPQKAPTYAPPLTTRSWTGFYIGGNVGYGWGSLTGDTARTVVEPPGFASPNSAVFTFDRSLDPQGVLGGFQVGYNFQAMRIVYGLEADFSWTGQRDSFDFSGRRNNFTTEDFSYQETLAAKLQYLGTVRGRIGYAFDQWLPYITGGFAWGRMETDLNWTLLQFATGTSTLSHPPASFSGSQAKTLPGWTLGAGFEYAFAERWSAKVEYLFVDLGKEVYFPGIQGGGSFGFQDHIVRLGVNFRL